MNRREHVSLMHIGYRSIKVLSFSLWSVIVILWCHDLEVRDKIAFNELVEGPFFIKGINWMSSIPIIFISFIILSMVSSTVSRCFINISQRIFVLSRPTPFVEKFFIASVEFLVIFRWGHMSSIIPSWSASRSGLINSKNYGIVLTLVKIYAFYFIS